MWHGCLPPTRSIDLSTLALATAELRVVHDFAWAEGPDGPPRLYRWTCFRQAVVQFARVKSGWTPMGIGPGGSPSRLRWLTFPKLPPVSFCSLERLFCRRSTSRASSPYADSRVHASASVNRKNARRFLTKSRPGIKKKEFRVRVLFMTTLFKNVLRGSAISYGVAFE